MSSLSIVTNGLQSPSLSGLIPQIYGIVNPSLASTPFFYIGTTQIELNRSSAPQALTGITSIDGSASSWTTARLLAGNFVNGSANVPFANKFIVQGTSDSGLTGAQFLGALGTGIVKNTTGSGVLSIAIAADFPVLNQDTTGTAQYADNVAVTNVTTNSTFYIPFVNNYPSGDYPLAITSAFKINPSTSTLSLGNLNLSTTSSTLGQLQFNNQTILHTYGGGSSYNTFLGWYCGNYSLTGKNDCVVGHNTLLHATTSMQTCAFGSLCLENVTSSSDLVAIGYKALNSLTSAGHGNVVIGSTAAQHLINGAYNIIFGYYGGEAYTSGESSNIIISNNGVLGESNVIRIGTQGSSTGEQNTCYIAGISGTTLSGASGVVLVDGYGKLGELTGSSNTILIGGSLPSFSSTLPSAIISSSHIAVTNADNSFSAVQTLSSGAKFATSGGIAATLNHNEEGFSHSTYYTGIWAADIPIAIYFWKLGAFTCMYIPTASGTATTASTITITDPIPARFRPTTLISFPYKINDGGTIKTGQIVIRTDGTIEIGTEIYNTAFSGANTSGTSETEFVYASA